MANAAVNQYKLEDLTMLGVSFREPFVVYTNLGIIATHPNQEDAMNHMIQLRDGGKEMVLRALAAN
jgi:hypothetical protein